jgi:diguanylate cyclase (GGDEF)-like protein/PAS domain S-box-containing protein
MNATTYNPAHLAVADLLDILPDAVIMVDGRALICYVNPAVRTMLGYAPEELLGQPLSLLVPHEVRQRHQVMVERFRVSGPPTLMGSRPVLHAVHRSGRLVPLSISLTNITLGDGERVSVAVMHDVAALNTELDRATAQAETDPLTQLGNRLRLSRRIQALLASERPFSLLLLDLERFKQLNDRLGHEAGDQALRIVARRLQARVRNADLAVRMGGDEFVVLLDGTADAPQLQARASSIAASLARPFRVDDTSNALGVNIGGAISPQHGRDERTLLAAADRAMYEAKQARELYRLAGS